MKTKLNAVYSSRELENTEDDDYTALEVEALEEDLKIVSLKPKPTLKNDVEMEDKNES